MMPFSLSTCGTSGSLYWTEHVIMNGRLASEDHSRWRLKFGAVGATEATEPRTETNHAGKAGVTTQRQKKSRAHQALWRAALCRRASCSTDLLSTRSIISTSTALETQGAEGSSTSSSIGIEREGNVIVHNYFRGNVAIDSNLSSLTELKIGIDRCE